MNDLEIIKLTANGNLEHAKLLIKLHLGTLATDANVNIVLAVMKL